MEMEMEMADAFSECVVLFLSGGPDGSLPRTFRCTINYIQRDRTLSGITDARRTLHMTNYQIIARMQ